jgi:putative copper export protein
MVAEVRDGWATVRAMNPKALFEWGDVAFECVGFLGSFGILGAVGFRFGVLRGRGAGEGAAEPFEAAARAARTIALVGVGLGCVSLVHGLLARAEAKHISFSDAFAAGGSQTLAQALLLGVLAVAFGLARRRAAIAWPIAGVSALALALRGVLAGRIAGLVNPLHVLGASLWIGTLFVLVVAGVGQLSRPAVPPGEREAGVALLVRRFSTLALGSAALLGTTGLFTAWKHLNPFAALWSTPYGYVLLAKLAVVGVVFGLGAWNWRRVGPALGHDGGAATIRRTARAELGFAGVVVVLTGILVSVPSPKAPAAHPEPSPAPTSAPSA